MGVKKKAALINFKCGAACGFRFAGWRADDDYAWE
jgi:hypothetical protein